MTSDQSIFLLELSSLLKKNKATIFYTRDDDGVHIASNGEDLFVGFLSDDDAGQDLYKNVIREGKRLT